MGATCLEGGIIDGWGGKYRQSSIKSCLVSFGEVLFLLTHFLKVFDLTAISREPSFNISWYCVLPSAHVPATPRSHTKRVLVYIHICLPSKASYLFPPDLFAATSEYSHEKKNDQKEAKNVVAFPL
jgi:hypothetical protein